MIQSSVCEMKLFWLNLHQ